METNDQQQTSTSHSTSRCAVAVRDSFVPLLVTMAVFMSCVGMSLAVNLP